MSGRHSRPASHPAPSTLAICATAVTALVAAPTTAQAASTEATADLSAGLGTQGAAIAKEVSTKNSVQARALVSRASTSSAKVSKARRAVRYAIAQLGDQYRWGGTGPRYFDCSGLTMMAWRQAGVRLPHSARLQYRRGLRVAKSRLRPGDLVFFYRARSHVGIYIGAGKMVHAANPRADILVSNISRGHYARAYAGARRIR